MPLAHAAAKAPDAAGGQVAVIPIHGTLVAAPSGLEAESGLMSYGGSPRNWTPRWPTPRSPGILLDIDSPGGGRGVFDLADRIRAASSHQARLGAWPTTWRSRRPTPWRPPASACSCRRPAASARLA